MTKGSNDNPTANEFKRLYRKLLVCHEVVYDGKKANCITNETGILTVSSEIVSVSSSVYHGGTVASIDLDDLTFNYQEIIDEQLDKFDEHLNAYAATKVEEKIKYSIQTKKNECKMCLGVFHENEKISDSFITRKMSAKVQSLQNQRSQPCQSTVHIIKAINKMHSLLPGKGYDVNAIILTVLQNLDYDDLYIDTDFEDHTDHTVPETEETINSHISHKEILIRNIVKVYINMKSHNIFQKITDEKRGVYIRHANRKQTHFAGQ